MSDWDNPDSSDFFKVANHIGDLVIIAVNEYLPSVTTTNGEAAAVKGEVAVVEGNDQDQRFPDALLFGRQLVPQLRNKVGGVVLGRFVQGTKQPGKNAPHQLEAATEEDKRKASAWINAHGPVASTAAGAKNVTGKTLTSVSAGNNNDEDAPF